MIAAQDALLLGTKYGLYLSSCSYIKGFLNTARRVASMLLSSGRTLLSVLTADWGVQFDSFDS